MKKVVVLGEGLSGEPLADLNGKTVLEAAKTPQLDSLGAKGILGLTRLASTDAGALDAAALSVLGYSPAEHRLARGPLEALGRGVTVQPGDVVFCADLVSLTAQPDGTETMSGMAAGGVDPAAALSLGEMLATALAGDGIELLPFAGHRQLLIWHGGEAGMRTVCPAQAIDRPIAGLLPTGPGADVLRDLMRRACEVLAPYALTDAAVREGRAAANALWLWGQGTLPALPALTDRVHGPVTAVTSTVRGRGLARLLGMTVVDGSATSNPLPMVLQAVDESDVCFVELDPFANHDLPARAHDRVDALERIDAQLMTPLIEHLRASGQPWRCLVLLSLAEAHSDQPAPFLMGVDHDQHGTRTLSRRFHERDAREQGIFIPEAHTLIERLLREA